MGIRPVRALVPAAFMLDWLEMRVSPVPLSLLRLLSMQRYRPETKCVFLIVVLEIHHDPEGGWRGSGPLVTPIKRETAEDGQLHLKRCI